MRRGKLRDNFISKCCMAPYESILVDGGKLELRCAKCGEPCGVLEEKYTKGKWPDCYDSLCK
jgi:hypothetical protein